MKIQIPRLKPASKASSVAHILLNSFVVLLIVGMVVDPISLPWLAVVLFLLSKWRMFAVKPRHWITNIRANTVDMTVGLSFISFLSGTTNLVTQLVWAGIFLLWIIWLKPKSTTLYIALQAMTAQALGLIAFYTMFSKSTILVLVLFTWLICYSAARHFFSAFEDQNGRIISHIWGLFAAQLAWVLGHWILTYGFLPQIALLLTVIGYGLAVCFYLYKVSRLKPTVRNQFVFVVVLIIVIVALFSKWQYSGL